MKGNLDLIKGIWCKYDVIKDGYSYWQLSRDYVTSFTLRLNAEVYSLKEAFEKFLEEEKKYFSD